ncbi:hypothetical protein ACQ4PT_035314 [Festuca glaucescens]
MEVYRLTAASLCRPRCCCRVIPPGDGGSVAAGEEFQCRCTLVLSVVVAVLLAFMQQNVTGPSGKFSPLPFQISSLDEGWYSDLGGKWDVWASDHLASLGSHVHGLRRWHGSSHGTSPKRS